MLAFISKIIHGFQIWGWSYGLRMIPNEFASPRSAVTRALRQRLVRLTDLGRGSAKGLDLGENLRFVYDLRVAPITFDFASYLAAAELERRRRRLTGLEVIIVTGSENRLRREAPDYERVLDLTARQWRVRHLLLPIAGLLPTVRAITLCSPDEAARLLAGEVAHLFPEDYRVHLPCYPRKRHVHELARAGSVVLPMFRASDHARRHVGTFIQRVAGKRKPVVITLREYAYSVSRNSKIAEWLAFVDATLGQEYAAVFVRDSETAMTAESPEMGGRIICDAASWNMDIRMALYEAAWLNMAVMHGPMELCWYSEACRYLIFLQADNSDVSAPAAIVESGQPLYRDLDFSRPWQHIVWADDRQANLTQAFSEMAKKLEDFPRQG